MGHTSRQLGEIGYKDNELIQKYFDKLHSALNERESGDLKSKAPLSFDQAVYGSFKNFIPRHYVFDGFETNQEFQKHLETLLEWQAERADGLQVMGVESSEAV